MKCKYGCGLEAKTQLKNQDWICGESWSQCPVNRKKNSNGLSKAHASGKMRTDQLSWKRNWRKGIRSISNENIFCENSRYDTGYVKKIILQEKIIEYKCSNESCGITQWMDDPIVLHLDHINGINSDQRLENLRFLCPNCHSQTRTYCGKNIQTGMTKVSDKDLLSALKKYRSIRKALISVGLAGKGKNYIRAKKLLGKNEVAE